MGGHAGLDALVATGAFVEIEQQQVLALHQLLFEEAWRARPAARGRGAAGPSGGGRAPLRLMPSATSGKALQHLGEVVGLDADELDEIDRGAGGGAAAGLERVFDHLEGGLADDEALARRDQRGLDRLHAERNGIFAGGRARVTRSCLPSTRRVACSREM